MDKLEEFFIRTVVSAQEQELPTSGAMSTTGIGGFLTEEHDKPDILNQLVSAASDRPAAPADVEIHKTQMPAESTRRQPADSELLEKLTKAAVEPDGSDIVEKTEPDKPEKTGAEEIKPNVLNELLGRTETDHGLTEPVDGDKTGENEDA